MPAAHPLDADAAGLSASSWLQIQGPSGPTPSQHGWRYGADLLQRLPEWIELTTAWLRTTYRADPPAVVAPTYVMGWYLDALARTTGSWLELTDRVPLCVPERFWLRLSAGGWPEATAVAAGDFYCLRDDAARDHPDARVLEDRRQLVSAYRDVVWTHADRFFAAFRPEVRIGSRQRSGMLADHVQTALIGAAESAGRRMVGLEDAFDVAGPGAGGLRRSCCFAYKLSDELLCTRCPRRGRRPGAP